MLVVFPRIFETDTKIIYGYNFVAPLRYSQKICFTQFSARMAA